MHGNFDNLIYIIPWYHFCLPVEILPSEMNFGV